MKGSFTSYILWLGGFFGIAGLHRFYLGRPWTGLLWLFTLGLGGVGTIIDMFLIPGMVRDENRKRLPEGGVHVHLHAGGTWPPGALPPGTLPSGTLSSGTLSSGTLPPAPEPKALPEPVPVEKQLLRLAQRHGGVLTPQMVALETDLSLKEAKRELDALVEGGHALVDVGEDGAEQYRIAGLAPSRPVLES